jgi:hypothetical protein
MGRSVAAEYPKDFHKPAAILPGRYRVTWTRKEGPGKWRVILTKRHQVADQGAST